MKQIPDMIDDIYDCLEKAFTDDEDAIKSWLRSPHNKLPHNMSPNEMLKAGKAEKLLEVTRKEFGCEGCPSSPPVLSLV